MYIIGRPAGVYNSATTGLPSILIYIHSISMYLVRNIHVPTSIVFNHQHVTRRGGGGGGATNKHSKRDRTRLTDLLVTSSLIKVQ